MTVSGEPGMKLLYCSTLDIEGGAARGAYRLHRGLLARGVDSTMLCAAKHSDDPTVMGPRSDWEWIWWRMRMIGARRILRLQRSADPIPHSVNVFPSFWSGRINAFGADIVQLHWIGSETMSVADVGRITAPIVWRLADMWPFAGTEHYGWPSPEPRWEHGYRPDNVPPKHGGLDLDRWVWKRKMRHWRHLDITVVAGSRWLADCARRSMLFAGRRVEAIPSGLDLSVFRPQGRARAREMLNLPQDKRLILFGAISATSDKRKGFDLLVPTLKRLAQRKGFDDVEALVLGAFPPKQAPDLGMKAHYIPKMREDLALSLVYSAADVLVAPSLMDNLPFSVMEAQACGVPCAAFDVGGMPDMIVHRENGWLAKPYEVEELSDGLAWMLEDEERGAELGRRSLAFAEREYPVDLQARRYMEIYGQILERRRREGKRS